MSVPPKFLGQGSYGCVYSPPPKCKNDNQSFEKDHIAKVFYNEAGFQSEQMIYDKIVNKVDPKHKFTPSISATCETNAQSVDKNEDHKCFFGIDGQKQLVMKNKGMDLNNVLKEDILYEKKAASIFKNMLPVIEGIQVMDKKNYAHLDIKPANMLFDPHTNEVTLIDFGLATTKGMIYRKNEIQKHCYRYIFYPPEFQYICKIRKKEHLVLSQFNSTFHSFIVHRFLRDDVSIQQSQIYQFLRAKLYQHMPDQELIDILYSFSWQGRTQHMENFHAEWNKVMRKHTVSRAKGDHVLLSTKILGMQGKVDVYMLGATLLILFLNSIERDMISIRKRDYTDIANNTKLYAGLMRLIAKAVHANPIQRITIQDFAKEYKQLLHDTGNPLKIPTPRRPRKEKKKLDVKQAARVPLPVEPNLATSSNFRKENNEKKKLDVKQAARVPLPVEPNLAQIANFIKEKPLEKRKTVELASMLALFGIHLPKQTRKDIYLRMIKEQIEPNKARQVWNPVTQKWVSSESQAGKILTNPMNKRCKDGKVINPDTNRCVSTKSDTIKSLMMRA